MKNETKYSESINHIRNPEHKCIAFKVRIGNHKNQNWKIYNSQNSWRSKNLWSLQTKFSWKWNAHNYHLTVTYSMIWERQWERLFPRESTRLGETHHLRISDKVTDCWCRLKSKLTFPVIGDTTAVGNESFDQKLAISEVSASVRQDTASSYVEKSRRSQNNRPAKCLRACLQRERVALVLGLP